MDKYVGKRLDGRYEIREIIGVGGMAVVYKAYDNVDDKIVAIKILKDECTGNDEFLRRFKNESKAITDALDNKINKEIEDREAAITAHTNSETVTTDLSAKESTYYLLGTEDSIGKGTEISQAKTTVEGSGVKYESGSEQENGKLYVDEERVTTGLYYTISE